MHKLFITVAIIIWLCVPLNSFAEIRMNDVEKNFSWESQECDFTTMAEKFRWKILQRPVPHNPNISGYIFESAYYGEHERGTGTLRIEIRNCMLFSAERQQVHYQDMPAQTFHTFTVQKPLHKGHVRVEVVPPSDGSPLELRGDIPPVDVSKFIVYAGVTVELVLSDATNDTLLANLFDTLGPISLNGVLSWSTEDAPRHVGDGVNGKEIWVVPLKIFIHAHILNGHAIPPD